MTCPKCNTKVIEGYGFCGNCWFDLLSVPNQPKQEEDPKSTRPPVQMPQAVKPPKQVHKPLPKPLEPQPAKPPEQRPVRQPPQPTVVRPHYERQLKPKNRVLLYIVLGLAFLGISIMAFTAPVDNSLVQEQVQPAGNEYTVELGFDSAEAAIIGDWQCRDTTQPHIWMCTLSFYADGRFVDGDGDWGYFRISGNSLTLDFDDFGSVTVDFELRGNRLTLTGPEMRIVLERV